MKFSRQKGKLAAFLAVIAVLMAAGLLGVAQAQTSSGAQTANSVLSESFDCTETAYVIQGTGGIPGTETSWLTEIDQSVSPFVFKQIPDASTFLGGRINNMGFNEANGLLYAWRIPSSTPTVTASLLTIDPTGTINLLGVPAGLPTSNPNANLNAGDVSPDQIMFLSNSGGYGNGNLYVVDLTTLTLTDTLPIQSSTGATQLGRVNDFAYNPVDGLLYGGDQDDGQLAILDPATGIRTDVALAGLPVDGPTVVRYGGAYFGFNGTLYLYENVSGTVYPVTDVTGTPTLGTPIPGTPSVDVDAASCSGTATMPQLELICPEGPGTRWDSYQNYVDRLLTVDFIISNTGSSGAFNVSLTGAAPSNPLVTISSGVPSTPSVITAGTDSTISVIYDVPVGITGYQVCVTATAEDILGNPYSYP